jgi:para-nitrobenzyl esterase
MKGLALAAVAGGLNGRALAEPAVLPVASRYPKIASATGDTIQVSGASPIVEMEYGRVRGYVRNGIYTFKGIPYGADTSGANRFLPALKPTPWTGVRSCLYRGFACPQPTLHLHPGDEYSFLFVWDEGLQDEDCLSVNVWTPALDNGKRPVMVWLHGGGYTMGASTNSPSYDGENLARRGDVVMVSLNHRIGVFGFLNLAAFGDKYALSSNVGLLDIVAALKWVHDNISRFGGDPNRVTIFGQSGGGGKVTMLLAMPSAKGLFHRAVIQSGSLLGAATMEASNILAEKLLKELNIGTSDVEKIHGIPRRQLQEAAAKFDPVPGSATEIIDFRNSALLKGWAPVAGNAALPEQPFKPKAPEVSASVPLIVGCTLNEFINGVDKPDCFKMTAEELEAKVRNVWPGSKADSVLAAYRINLPGANHFELWSVIGSNSVRAMTLEQCRLKAEQKAAPAYCYRFDWHTPVLDGRPLAQHGADLPFPFDNTQRFENMTGNGPAARALAARMSETWIHFARTGDPNHPGIPHWKPFDPTTNGTMLFDDECAFREHLDDECQKVVNIDPNYESSKGR